MGLRPSTKGPKWAGRVKEIKFALNASMVCRDELSA